MLLPILSSYNSMLEESHLAALAAEVISQPGRSPPDTARLYESPDRKAVLKYEGCTCILYFIQSLKICQGQAVDAPAA